MTDDPKIDPKIARFRALKAQFPTSEMPRWSLATAYEDAGRLAEAIAEFEELVAVKPDYCVAWVHLGACLIEEERYAEAVTALEEGRRLALEQGHEAPRGEADMLLEQARAEM